MHLDVVGNKLQMWCSSKRGQKLHGKNILNSASKWKATRNMNSDWRLMYSIIRSNWIYAGKRILRSAKILNSVIWEVICTEMSEKNSVQVLYTFSRVLSYRHKSWSRNLSYYQLHDLTILYLMYSPNWSRILPDYKYYLVWPIYTAYPGQKNLKLWTVVQNLTTLNSSSANWLEMYKLSTWCFLSYLAASIFT
jgi:hypothetical protein